MYVSRILDFLAVLFTFLGENKQNSIKIFQMVIFGKLSGDKNLCKLSGGQTLRIQSSAKPQPITNDI